MEKKVSQACRSKSFGSETAFWQHLVAKSHTLEHPTKLLSRSDPSSTEQKKKMPKISRRKIKQLRKSSQLRIKRHQFRRKIGRRRKNRRVVFPAPPRVRTLGLQKKIDLMKAALRENYLYGLWINLLFFWLVAAWVKSRAERPSVSGVNRQLHVQIGCKLGIRNRKDELTKQAKRNKLQIKPEGN